MACVPVDSDGDVDLIVTTRNGNNIVYFENIAGSAAVFATTRTLISTALDGPLGVAVGDVSVWRCAAPHRLTCRNTVSCATHCVYSWTWTLLSM